MKTARQSEDTAVTAGDPQSLELADILDSKAIQALMDNFYRLTRVPMSIIDLKGNVLVGVGWQRVCTSFHRVHSETCKNCIESDTELMEGLQPGEFKLYKCKNNMWDVATPMIVGGRRVGAIFSGQFFFDDEPVDYDVFREQARRFGFDEGDYLSALEAVPRLSRDTVQSGMDFLLKLGQMVSVLTYNNAKLVQALAERETLTASLRESEKRLNRSQAIAHLGSWELDVPSNTLTWSDEVYRIFGLAPQEFGATYEAFLEAVHPDDRAAVDGAYSGSIRDGRDTYEIVHRVVRRGTGEIRWVHEKCEHARDGSGAIIRSMGMVQDITERKLAEDALRDSKEALRSAALFPEQNPSPVLRVRSDGALLFANPSARTLVAGCRCMTDQIVPDIVRRPVQATLDEGCPREVEIKVGGRDFSFIVTPIAGQDYANLYGRDVTDRNHAEQAMREAQKLESIGVLAGGIAHDFNNLLTSILGNASLLQLEPAVASKTELTAIMEASERAASLAHQLLAYAGKCNFLVRDVDVVKLLRSSAELIRVSIPRNIDLLLNSPADLPAVRGDASQIQQVLMNLIINAAEAITGTDGAGVHGRVSITSGVRSFDKSNEVVAGLAAGTYVFVSVQDNGCGMDPETRSKIFDPFFTTKFTGRGLGLAAVQGIVRSHKGAITVETAPRVGSVFTVYLPSNGYAASALLPSEPRVECERALKILSVDDEDAVRVMLRTLLRRLGHTVQLARNGKEALEAIEAHGAPDLVILDMIMPVKGGAETYSEIRRRWPETAILVTSGYSADEVRRLGIPADAALIEKPYTAKDLAAALAKAMSTRPPARPIAG